MAKSEFGLNKVNLKKEDPKQQVATPALKPRKVITYRIGASDQKVLKTYALMNDTSVQELIDRALRLLAVENDMPLSNEIMKK